MSEATQARYLTAAFSQLALYPYVTVALAYNFRNDYWLNNDPTNLEANYGLLRTDFSAKPAYAAFKAYAILH